MLKYTKFDVTTQIFFFHLPNSSDKGAIPTPLSKVVWDGAEHPREARFIGECIIMHLGH